MKPRLFLVHTTASRETELDTLYVLAKDYGQAEKYAVSRIPGRATVWKIEELTPLEGGTE